MAKKLKDIYEKEAILRQDAFFLCIKKIILA
jgi:hypothetical protein